MNVALLVSIIGLEQRQKMYLTLLSSPLLLARSRSRRSWLLMAAKISVVLFLLLKLATADSALRQRKDLLAIVCYLMRNWNLTLNCFLKH